MSRLTGDLEAIRMFIGFGFAPLNLVLMVTFGSIMMFTISWKLTLVTLVAMPFLVVAALKFESKIHPAFQEMRLALSSLTTAVQENITGVRTVKSLLASLTKWRNSPNGMSVTKPTRYLPLPYGPVTSR